MKGTIFQKPLEFQIRIDGETWNQGDRVSGELTIKNHGPEPVPLSAVKVLLAHGGLKKVHARAVGAFKVQSQTSITEPEKLAPTGETVFPWFFPLDRNSPVSDNSASLFLVYGQCDVLEKAGQLQLNVQPFAIIQEFLKTLEIDFRFVRKNQKALKAGLEVKLDPPDSRSFSSVDQLALNFRFEEETIHIHYVFHIRKVEPTATSAEVTKQTRELEQQLEKNHYTLPSGRPNHAAMASSIREALDLVESKVLF